MNSFLLAESNIPVIGPIIEVIANALGYIMQGIYDIFDGMGIASIALSIILFTVIVRACMIPLFVKQQKFTRITQIMNPEIMEVNNKYKGKRDNESMMAMQNETKAIYRKYGTSPTGSCWPIAIQMPLLWAVYLVIRNIQDFIPSLYSAYENIIAQLPKSYVEDTILSDLTSDEIADLSSSEITKQAITQMSTYSSDTWASLKDAVTGSLSTVESNIEIIHNTYSFLGMDLSISAWTMLKSGMIFAVLLPVFAAFIQWVSMRLSMARSQKHKTTSATASNQYDPMAASMKTMNIIMPIFSLWICFTLPAGVALYWAIGSLVQVVIQALVNRHLDHEGVDRIIEKNIARAEKKRKKSKDYVEASTVASSAQIKTKTLASNLDVTNKDIEKNTNPNIKYKEGSLASKASLVNKYNEKNK